MEERCAIYLDLACRNILRSCLYCSTLDPTSIPLIEVVDAWEIFTGPTNKAHTGRLGRPSNAQLMDAFDTTNFESIFKVMAQKGHLQSAGKHGNILGRLGAP